LFLLLAAVAAWAHDVTGKWEFNVQTDAGGGTPGFVFKQAGEKLTGTVKGDNIEFSFEVSLGGPRRARWSIRARSKVWEAERGRGRRRNRSVLASLGPQQRSNRVGECYA
jgi:hypothetical protein